MTIDYGQSVHGFYVRKQVQLWRVLVITILSVRHTVKNSAS